MSLVDAGVPVIIVDVLCNWYSKLRYAVRWNGAFCRHSLQTACSGVRQRSCLSPAIFNIFMNIYIEQLKCLGIGCCVSSLFLGCILYTDDILLLSPSITGLCPNSTYSICCGFVVDLLYNFSICCGLVVDFMGQGVSWPKIKSKMADSDDEDELLVTFATTSV